MSQEDKEAVPVSNETHTPQHDDNFGIFVTGGTIAALAALSISAWHSYTFRTSCQNNYVVSFLPETAANWGCETLGGQAYSWSNYVLDAGKAYAVGGSFSLTAVKFTRVVKNTASGIGSLIRHTLWGEQRREPDVEAGLAAGFDATDSPQPSPR